ncbi:acetyltransferase [Psychrobium sp. 1_MG-2023]|uniref:acetyltransferase n=1 Tax=Psychrobium sp. 1_MG-2023 TaxID=3062624 RepID=UPI000C339DF1|nr:acetyltransferase [Psychrobium sp. 1_MG-2023]MDP2562117.1 acetyltransferase [Psychrobium sp. 1_MG-2023]PKF55716.1 acetyltransferase [Alteromonadales bacterium alter-6D02]
MSKVLAVIGASGHGKVVADLAVTLGFDVVFFDDAYPSKLKVEHWPINGVFKDFINDNDLYCGAIVAIGNAKARESITNQLNELNIYTPILQHPSAIVSSYASIGGGSVIMPGAVVNAFASIGIGCIINSNAVIEHDCKLECFVHVCPCAAVAGGTIIGKRTWVGIGSNIRQLITIESDVLIGAGSVVVNDISKGTTVGGVPAKAIKDNNA